MSHEELRRKIAANSHITHSCPECSAAVKCEITLGKSTCWCFTVSTQIREVEWDGLCMCPTCLKGNGPSEQGSPNPLTLGAGERLECCK